MATTAYMKDADLVAYKDQTEFTEYEKACLLARVTPNADMVTADLDAVRAKAELLQQIRDLYADYPDQSLFLKLIAQ